MSHDHCFCCPECEKHLSIPVAGVGLVCTCPDCETSFKIHDPVIEFNCTSCDWELCASAQLLGESFHCPNCSEELAIPAADKLGVEQESEGRHVIFCKNCNAKLDYDDEFEKDMGGQTIDCPECSGPVEIPDVNKAVPKQDTVVAKHCFRCYAEMAKDLKICPICRTNQDTGERGR